MGKSSKVGISVLVSSLISMLLVAGAGFFALPLIYPNINEEIEEIEEFEETPNIVLQSKYIDISTQAELRDEELDFVKINDTELSITTQGNSSLAVLFTMTIVTHIAQTFWGDLHFELAIVISGIGSKTIPIKYFRLDTGDPIHYTQHITINYNTGVVSSGTYTIEVFWRSMYTALELNQIKSYLWVSGEGYINYTRTIWAQELRV